MKSVGILAIALFCLAMPLHAQVMKRNFGAWHYQCGRCKAMFAEAEGEKAKHKCPSCKVRLSKADGDIKSAAFKCPKCALRWSAATAKSMKMACPGCKAKLVPTVKK